MAKDETFFLPIWFRYYASQFGAENLFILDHSSDISPRDILPPDLREKCVNVFQIPSREICSPSKLNKRFDTQRFGAISEFLRGLLRFYDVVIFNDADEIYVPDPGRFSGLRDYVERRAKKHGITAGLGLEMFHDTKTEADFNPDLPIFAQRRHFFCSMLYSKPHVLTEGCSIWPHSSSKPFYFDPDLSLIHMKFIDEGRFFSRQEERRALRTSVATNSGKPWLWTQNEAALQLQKYNELPVADTPFEGREVAKRFVGSERAVIVGADGGLPRYNDKKADRIRLIDFVKPEDDRDIIKTRRVLPERYLATGI